MGELIAVLYGTATVRGAASFVRVRKAGEEQNVILTIRSESVQYVEITVGIETV